MTKTKSRILTALALTTLLARFFGGDVKRGGNFILFVGYLTTAGVAFVNFVLLANLSGRTLGKWVAGLRIERRMRTGLHLTTVNHDYLATKAAGGHVLHLPGL